MIARTTAKPVQAPVIALDVMGGDAGLADVLAAADMAAERYPKLRFRLHGPQDRIAAELARLPRLAAAAETVHTDEVVLGTDKPSQALRRSRTSSMGMAIQSVKDGAAHAAVSAGNTGALMALSLVSLRTMKGIDRPALAALLPTLKNDSVVLDLGANTECDTENLVQFSIMGAAFARTVLGLDRPRVALLNIGEEELKGTEEIKEAAALLRSVDLPMVFEGFVEGDKIGQGNVDVIVTDGFSGNIALKTAEGTGKLVTGLLAQAFRSSWLTQLGYFLSRGALRALRAHLDPNAHNGAVLLGLNGLVVKSHGSANIRGLANAIGVAHDLVVDNVSERIAQDLANFSARRPHTPLESTVAEA
ncbi:phosphate acyltransferase [Polymorphobacter multimanifer]|uniref:Phosphate acyltransferase n=1 Tax=Polymorphobacter multimanifer TaxID=1070431 RepID=A0A841LA38_9SPHN|nr:phosphate acyltransferase PlsX [Polymorphobacter multimanifer]MBB6229006.1 glycerol-3-phosphate acyltransferase PlsX [Polymorphobacter multimanifer]GGI78463.1 phosphate acyltransferase [Polymorphobacter multimanifer]